MALQKGRIHNIHNHAGLKHHECVEHATEF